MTWGHYQPHRIESHSKYAEESCDREHKIRLKVGTRIMMGEGREVYIKTKRDGTFNINAIDLSNNKEIRSRTIAEVDKEWIKILRPRQHTYEMCGIFNLSLLKRRTIGTDHVILRQDSIEDYPQLNVRLDKPVYIHRITNEMKQDVPLKKRIFDKVKSKQFRELCESFRHEITVLAKFPAPFMLYMTESGNEKKPIKIKGTEYESSIAGGGSYYQKSKNGMVHKRWLKRGKLLNTPDRLKLAILTIMELNGSWHFNSTPTQRLHSLQSTAKNLLYSSNPMQESIAYGYFHWDCIEAVRIHLGIVKYEEQK